MGAALETASGEVFCGCNVESSTYGLTVCAERVALLKAVSEGHKEFKSIAVVAERGPCTPCGACRQLLWEFAPDLVVILEEADGTLRRHPLRDLLPAAFDARYLEP